MAKKKPVKKSPEKSEDSELTKRVDAIMDEDSSHPGDAIAVNIIKKHDAAPVAELSTAPELPGAVEEVEDEAPAEIPLKHLKPLEIPLPKEPKPEPETEPEAESEESPAEDLGTSDNFDDPETDKAVEDIVSKEGDLALAVDDIRREKAQPAPKSSRRAAFWYFLKSFFWMTIAVACVAIVIVCVLFLRGM